MTLDAAPCKPARAAAIAAAAAVKQARYDDAMAVLSGRKVQQVMASRRVKITTPAAASTTVAVPSAADPAATVAAIGTTATTTSTIEFLCKFEHHSHRQMAWLPLSVLQETAEGKLRGHWRRHDASPANPEVQPDYPGVWTQPERVVAEDKQDGEMLVKWQGLNYDECTWEPIEDASEEAVAAAAAAAGSEGDEEGKRGDVVGRRKSKGGGDGSDDDNDDGSDDEEEEEELGGTLVEGGGNGGVAAELAIELASFRARAARAAPPRTPLPEASGLGGVVFDKIAHLLPQAGSAPGTDTAAADAKAAIAAAAAGDQAHGRDGSAGGPDAVPRGLSLHTYQREGVQWLLSKLKMKQSAILGDQMGLGKTIQTAVFVDAARALGLMRGPVLIVAPLSTVPNWTAELRLWCPTLNCVTYGGNAESRITTREYEFPKGGKGSGGERCQSGSHLDILLTSYEVAMVDSSSLDKIKWGAVIVDEGHRLKNFQSRLSRTLAALRAPFRCLLTGTPLQNNLEELFALLHFLEPVKFKDPTLLAEAFTADAAKVARRQKGGDGGGSGGGDGGGDGDEPCEVDDDDGDSHEAVAEAAATQLNNLHKLLGNHMLRRLKRDVLKGLPKKRKVEVSCQLSPFQREVYADVLARNHRAFNQGTHASQRTSLLNVLKELQKVCNHPFLFPSAEKDAFKAARTSGLAKKIAAAAAAAAEEAATTALAAAKSAAGGGSDANGGGGGVDEGGGGSGGKASGRLALGPAPPITAPSPLEATLLRTSSGKMQLLAKMIPKLKQRGHRILLFCQMTRMLDLLEDWLRASGMGFEDKRVDDGDEDEVEKVYGRIDGSTPSSGRQRVINAFNAPNSGVFLLLISTRAGGLGLNLATADTIILFDPDFNPFVDLQAQARAHRMGQQREVAVYQLVTAGTVEERIVEMARGKLAIERLVVAQADGGGKSGRRKSRDGEGGDIDDIDGDDDENGNGGVGGGKRKAGGGKDNGGVGGSEHIRGRAAELAEVLMHGARGVMRGAHVATKSAAADDSDDPAAAAAKERMTTAAAEPTDAEVERLLDRANLPEEVDGEDGAAYLGNVGSATFAIGGDGDGDPSKVDGTGGDDAAAGGDDAGMALELLLSERAARLGAMAEEQLGRGKRERRQAVNTLGVAGAEQTLAGSGAGGGGNSHGTCHVCGGDDDRDNLLLCGGCTAGAHVVCLGLSRAPPGTWHCGTSYAAQSSEGVCAGIGTAFPGGRRPSSASGGGDGDEVSDGGGGGVDGEDNDSGEEYDNDSDSEQGGDDSDSGDADFDSMTIAELARKVRQKETAQQLLITQTQRETARLLQPAAEAGAGSRGGGGEAGGGGRGGGGGGRGRAGGVSGHGNPTAAAILGAAQKQQADIVSGSLRVGVAGGGWPDGGQGVEAATAAFDLAMITAVRGDSLSVARNLTPARHPCTLRVHPIHFTLTHATQVLQ